MPESQEPFKTHRWVQERLSDYLDHQLNQSEQARLEQHLTACKQCTQDLLTLRQTVAWLHALPARSVPRPLTLPETQLNARRSTSEWVLPYFRFAAAFVAVLLVLVIALDALQFTPLARRNISFGPEAISRLPLGLSPAATPSPGETVTFTAETPTPKASLTEPLPSVGPNSAQLQTDQQATETFGETSAAEPTAIVGGSPTASQKEAPHAERLLKSMPAAPGIVGPSGTPAHPSVRISQTPQVMVPPARTALPTPTPPPSPKASSSPTAVAVLQPTPLPSEAGALVSPKPTGTFTFLTLWRILELALLAMLISLLAMILLLPRHHTHPPGRA